MQIAPSVLAADLGDLRGALDLCARGDADLIHVDVMDGHFVPNLSFGPPVIEGIDRHTEQPLDIHLMVERPEELMDKYLAFNPHWVSVHFEATTHLDRLINLIKDSGVGAGVALNPATPIEVLSDILGTLDFVLIMSVNPGFAGQPFVRYSLDKVRRLKRLIEERGLHTKIEIDGGVAGRNLEEVRDSGVDVAVVGSGIFGVEDPLAELRDLRARAGDQS